MALKEQQYQILKVKDTRALGTSLLIIPELRVLVLTKRHVGSGNEIGKRVKCFTSTLTTPEVGESRDYRDVIVFQKAPFSYCSVPSRQK